MFRRGCTEHSLSETPPKKAFSILMLTEENPEAQRIQDKLRRKMNPLQD
jgi:hypothetical protein